ncbi:hypothetical protein H0H92_013498, partial [Tricholoma furcatifolium]
GIIPSSQIATQLGVQHRDLLSLLAQVQTWAVREKTPLYVLQRDQKKGFDRLEPQGFYDAIKAYNLPDEIRCLDESAQSAVPYQVKMAYGLTDPFVVDGVTKQGGSLSPLKCTLTTSMLNHWLADNSDGQTGSVILQTHRKRTHTPHTLDDKSRVPLTFLEAMDDSLLFNTT